MRAWRNSGRRAGLRYRWGNTLGGSNPLARTKTLIGPLGSLVTHLIRVQVYAGSNPAGPTKACNRSRSGISSLHEEVRRAGEMAPGRRPRPGEGPFADHGEPRHPGQRPDVGPHHLSVPRESHRRDAPRRGREHDGGGARPLPEGAPCPAPSLHPHVRLSRWATSRWCARSAARTGSSRRRSGGGSSRRACRRPRGARSAGRRTGEGHDPSDESLGAGARGATARQGAPRRARPGLTPSAGTRAGPDAAPRLHLRLPGHRGEADPGAHLRVPARRQLPADGGRRRDLLRRPRLRAGLTQDAPHQRARRRRVHATRFTALSQAAPRARDARRRSRGSGGAGACGRSTGDARRRGDRPRPSDRRRDGARGRARSRAHHRPIGSSGRSRRARCGPNRGRCSRRSARKAPGAARGRRSRRCPRS